MRNKSIFQNKFFAFFIIPLISFVLLFLLYGIIKQESKIEENIFKVSSSDIVAIANNNARAIEKLLKNSDNFIEDIKNKQHIHDRIEENLQLLLTKNIKYAYLLYKDEKNTFRFLVDASSGNSKALINQKFDIDSPLWLDVFYKKDLVIIRNDFLNNLSTSYLFPVFNKKEVELVLVMDFSVQKAQEMNDLIDLMKTSVISMIVVIAIILFVFIIQTFKYRQVKQSSYVDSLTEVYNRNYLQDNKNNINLNDYIIAALDIDYFKKVNDNYGHSSGDKVLKEVGRVILSTIRTNDDIIIRYGGEEFLVFIKVKDKNTKMGLKVINRIFKNIQGNTFFVGKKEFIKITVSIGVNLSPFESRNFDEAFKLADIALYKAKSSGRNQINIFKEEEKAVSIY